MQHRLTNLFNESLDIFFSRETQNIRSGVSERNWCGRLAIYMTTKLGEYGLSNYYADTEYNRKQDVLVKTILDDKEEVVKIQCDLIIHSRGEIMGADNLIAIEMKKSTRPRAEKEADRKRLMAMTKDSYDGIWSYDGKTHPEHVCGYKLGVYMIVNIARRTCKLEYYEHGRKVHERTLYWLQSIARRV